MMSGYDHPNGDFSRLVFVCPEMKAGGTASYFSRANILKRSLQGKIALLHIVHLN